MSTYFNQQEKLLFVWEIFLEYDVKRIYRGLVLPTAKTSDCICDQANDGSSNINRLGCGFNMICDYMRERVPF